MAEQTEIATWLSAHQISSGDEADPASEEVILSFLSEDIAPQDVIHRIKSIPEVRGKSFAFKDRITKIENDVLSLAIEFPDIQERLKFLLLELEKESTDRSKWLFVDVHDDMIRSWRDIFDYNTGKRVDTQIFQQPEVQSLITKWTNWHSFASSMIAGGTKRAIDWPYYPISKTLNKEGTELEQTIHLRATAYWFINASSALWHEIQNTEQSRNKDAKALPIGSEFWSFDKWKSWKDQWNVIYGLDSINDNEKELARRALVSMEKAERVRDKKKN